MFVFVILAIGLLLFAVTHPIRFARHLLYRGCQLVGMVSLGLGVVVWFSSQKPTEHLLAGGGVIIGVLLLVAANRLDRSH